MTGRERVHRCLEFDNPDRPPRDLWELPIAHLTHGKRAIQDFRRRWPTDFDGPGLANSGLSSLVEGDPYAVGRFQDEWGCVFRNIQAGVIGEVKEPLLSDWSRLEGLRVPEEALDLDVDAVNRNCAASDCFVNSDCCARPFERLQFLRGSENLFLDLATGPPELFELLRLVHDFYCRQVEAWGRTNVDGILFMDDWGAQRSLLIHPDQWRRLFKPLYADYVRLAHDAGKKILMHTDGYIFDIYPDLIEIGVDAVNSQLFCMDIEAIGQQFKGDIAFWGEIDRQHVLPAGTPAEVEAAVERLVRHLYNPQGGIIIQFELGAGAKLANADAVFRVWEQLTGA